jgi:hypothetical protein
MEFNAETQSRREKRFENSVFIFCNNRLKQFLATGAILTA